MFNNLDDYGNTGTHLVAFMSKIKIQTDANFCF